MSEVCSRRVFFALWPDEEATAQLSTLARHLGAGGGRVMRPAALHLTLVFVGSVTPNQLAQLAGIAAGVCVEGFDLSIDRLGFWPQRGILWAGCLQPPEPLRRLAELLVGDLRAAGIAVEHRSATTQVPHITLLRRAHGQFPLQLATPICWHVGEFVLAETHLHPSAASYQALASFPLKVADAG